MKKILFCFGILFILVIFAECGTKEKPPQDVVEEEVLKQDVGEDKVIKEDVLEDKLPPQDIKDVLVEIPEKEKEEKDINFDVLPKKWEPSTFVNSLQIITDQVKVEQNCPDYTGDEKGDNALKSIGGFVNPEIKKAIEAGKNIILFEFVGVKDFKNTPSFTFNGLIGKKTEKEGEYLVDPKSYDCKDSVCNALISFENTKIENGELSAGPSTFSLKIPVSNLVLDFELKESYIEGVVDEGGGDGVVVSNGLMAGKLTKDAVDKGLGAAEEACKAPNAPKECNLLKLVKTYLPTLFDIDEDNDGKKDAMSVCTSWTGGKAVIVGIKED